MKYFYLHALAEVMQFSKFHFIGLNGFLDSMWLNLCTVIVVTE